MAENAVKEKKELTEEEKKALEAEKAKRKAAKKTIFDFAKKLDPKAKDQAELQNAIKLLLGFGKEKKQGQLVEIRNMLVATGATGVTEMALFQKYKIGRGEMARNIRAYINAVDENDRVWCTFNAEKETYFCVGKGKDAPKGWDGPLPAQKEKI